MASNTLSYTNSYLHCFIQKIILYFIIGSDKQYEKGKY